MTDEQRAAEVGRTLSTIGGLGRMAVAIPEESVDSLLKQMENFEAFAVFTDPTGWIQNQRQVRGNKAVVEAFRTFRNACVQAATDELTRVVAPADRSDDSHPNDRGHKA